MASAAMLGVAMRSEPMTTMAILTLTRCVFLWSLGNEAGLGPTHMLMHRWAHARDPSRAVHYEGLGNACNGMPRRPRTPRVEKTDGANPG